MANPKKNKTKTFLNKKSKNQEWNPNRKKSEDTKIRKKNAIDTILTKLCSRKWSTTKNLLNQYQDASQQPRGEEA